MDSNQSRTSVDVVVKAETCPYENCGKIFTSRWSMTRHMRTHTGEKPFKCPVEGCDKEFIENCALKRHLHTHSNGKVFECPLCDKMFKYRDMLESHLCMHSSTGENAQIAGGGAGSDHDTQQIIDELRATLVRISMHHHQELSKHLAEIEWLKRALLECSEALQHAIGLLKGAPKVNKIVHKHTGDEIEAQSALTSLAQAPTNEADSLIPAKLVEAVAKFNAENIANICKPHSPRPPIMLSLPAGAYPGDFLRQSLPSSFNGDSSMSYCPPAGQQFQGSRLERVDYLAVAAARGGPALHTAGVRAGTRGVDVRARTSASGIPGASSVDVVNSNSGSNGGPDQVHSFETNRPLVEPMSYYMPVGPLDFLGGDRMSSVGGAAVLNAESAAGLGGARRTDNAGVNPYDSAKRSYDSVFGAMEDSRSSRGYNYGVNGHHMYYSGSAPSYSYERGGNGVGGRSGR